MDLPLAASEPSPPDRSSHGLQLARDLLDTQTVYQLWVPLQPLPTRARFDFAPRTHRERIHSVVFDPTQFGASRELIICMQRNVKKRMALGVIFFCAGLLCCHFLRRKKHVRGLLTLSAAFFHVQHQVILQDILIF